jgi:hypothetical protein
MNGGKVIWSDGDNRHEADLAHTILHGIAIYRLTVNLVQTCCKLAGDTKDLSTARRQHAVDL